MTAPPDPLGAVLAAEPAPFALLHRPGARGHGVVEVVTGPVRTVRRMADLAVRTADDAPAAAPGTADLLVLVPYRQVTERGFVAVDDHERLLELDVETHTDVPLVDVVRRLPAVGGVLTGGFAIDDDAYADVVRTVVRDEIGAGAGANFVIHRPWEGRVTGPPLRAALAAFRRLLSEESGAYWTFLVHTGDRTFVGASPEPHVTLRDRTVAMTPVSGTYRYPRSGPTLEGVLAFLADGKEADELNMVLDEEVKMVSALSTDVRVRGPFLREMGRLAHTEYVVEGRTTVPVTVLLRDTMLAPTVTGSPLANACRVVAGHEGRGRGYYSGFAALVGRDAAGHPWVDSTILIRTADVRSSGDLHLGVGATLVRHSDPASEVAETAAKASGVLSAFGPGVGHRFAGHTEVRAALDRRAARMSTYWRGSVPERSITEPALPVRDRGRALVVDAEDAFTAMIADLLRADGWDTRVVPCTRTVPDDATLGDVDLVVLGPGPGDPRDDDDARVRALRRFAEALPGRGVPFVAVCLGHQVTARALGLAVTPHPVPRQGLQRAVDLFGAREVVGFYNSFVVVADGSRVVTSRVGEVTVALDEATGEVHALRGRGFATMQFHPESVLTLDGERLLGEAVDWARRTAAGRHETPVHRAPARV